MLRELVLRIRGASTGGREWRVSLGLVACAVLAACGGAGGGSSSGNALGSSAAPAYSASVSVSGLIGSLEVSTPFGGKLSLTADGTVTLGTVSAGANSNVQITAQPAGQRCAPSDGVGALTASAPTAAINCVNLLTSTSEAFRAGDVVSLGRSAALPSGSLTADGSVGVSPVKLRLQDGTLSFVVPLVEPGSQVLKTEIAGRAYEFGFRITERESTATPPAQVLLSVLDLAKESMAQLRTGASAQRLADLAALESQLSSLTAQFNALPPREQAAVATLLEPLLADAAPSSSPSRPLADPSATFDYTSDATCSRGSRRFVKSVITVVALIPAYSVGPWLGIAAVIYQGVALAEMMRFIETFLDNECFDISAVVLKINAITFSSGSSAPGVPNQRILSAGIRADSPAATPAPVPATHGSPISLGGNAKGQLPAALTDSAAGVQEFLSVLGAVLPDSFTSVLRQWTPTFERPTRLDRFRVTTVSRDDITFASVAGTPGRLDATFWFKDLLAAPAAVDFNFRLTDAKSRTFDFAATLSPLEVMVIIDSVKAAPTTYSYESAGQLVTVTSNLVTITGRARSGVDMGYLVVSTNPSMGNSPEAPQKASCGAWTGRVKPVSYQEYCFRTGKDPAWTAFSYTMYMSPDMLARRPVSYAMLFTFPGVTYSGTVEFQGPGL